MESINYQEAVNGVMNDCMGDIKKAVKEQVKQNIIDGLYCTVREQVSEEVRKFTESEEFKAMIKEQLDAAKPEILKSVREASINLGAEVAKFMTEKFASNIEHSWKFGDLIKAMFS